jgi:hypothetical protein
MMVRCLKVVVVKLVSILTRVIEIECLHVTVASQNANSHPHKNYCCVCPSLHKMNTPNPDDGFQHR